MSGLIVITCDCGQRLNAKAENAGKSFKCPKCGTGLTVPVLASISEYAPPQGEPESASGFPTFTPDPEEPVHQPAASVKIPKPAGKFIGGWTGFVGRWLAILGFAVCIRYMFFFDQSIESEREFSSSRIINMGLANDRIVGMIWGLTLVAGGGLIQVVDTLKEIWKKIQVVR